MPLSPSVSEASSTVVEMGMAERSMYDPNEVPESRTVENRHASDGRESNDHSQQLGRTGSPRRNLCSNFRSKIVKLVAVPVPSAREDFKTAGHFPDSAYKVLALAGQRSLFSYRAGMMICRP
jgi:hypothetical protein